MWNIISFLCVQERWMLHLILNANTILSHCSFFLSRYFGLFILSVSCTPSHEHSSGKYLPLAIIRLVVSLF